MRLTLALACSLLLVLGSGYDSRETAPGADQSAGSVVTSARDPLNGRRSPLSAASLNRFVVPTENPGAETAGAVSLAVTRRLSGTATWCAPTPRYCRNWGGKAMLAAVPSFRYGDEPYTVQVTGFYGGKANAVLVTVVSYCACPRTAIDLSPHAFAQLAPLSVGRIRVVVDGVKAGRSIPLAPPTDTDGG